MGGDQPDRRPRPTPCVENFGWPCYEGAAAQPGYDAPTSSICENLYAAGQAPTRRRSYATTTRQGRPRRDVPDRQLVDRPGSPSIRRPGSTLPGRLPGRAVLRRLLARLHLGDAHGRRPAALARVDRDLRLGAANRSTCSSAPAATSTTSTSTAGRFGVSATSRRTSRRLPSQRPTRRAGPRRSCVNFDGRGSSDPEGPVALRLGPRR